MPVFFLRIHPSGVYAWLKNPLSKGRRKTSVRLSSSKLPGSRAAWSTDTASRLSVLSIDLRGVLDVNTVVSRAAPTDGGAYDRPPSGAMPKDIPSSMEKHSATPFVPQLFVGTGSDRRDFARVNALHRPGVYILMNDDDGYVGLGSNVGQRVATGQQPIDGIETVIAVVDANNFLTGEDARVVERILWSRLSASGERQLVNGVPDGAAVDPQRYSELDVFVAQACLTMRHQGLLFTESSARAVLAGPRSEPGRLEKARLLTAIPAGEILELNFGKGLMAVAARQSERQWVLLCGSDVRRTPVPSANGTAGFLRAAWAHSGLLNLSHDGSSYTTQRDLVFFERQCRGPVLRRRKRTWPVGLAPDRSRSRL